MQGRLVLSFYLNAHSVRYRNQLVEKEQDSLWVFYKSAYNAYQSEVVKCGKFYNRYKNDYLKSHTYTDRTDAAGKTSIQRT